MIWVILAKNWTNNLDNPVSGDRHGGSWMGDRSQPNGFKGAYRVCLVGQSCGSAEVLLLANISPAQFLRNVLTSPQALLTRLLCDTRPLLPCPGGPARFSLLTASEQQRHASP